MRIQSVELTSTPTFANSITCGAEESDMTSTNAAGFGGSSTGTCADVIIGGTGTGTGLGGSSDGGGDGGNTSGSAGSVGRGAGTQGETPGGSGSDEGAGNTGITGTQTTPGTGNDTSSKSVISVNPEGRFLRVARGLAEAVAAADFSWTIVPDCGHA